MTFTTTLLPPGSPGSPVRVLRMLATASLLFLAPFGALAQTKVPTRDVAGLTDPPGLKRFAGSVLLYRDDAAYDEVVLPISRPQEKNDKAFAPRVLARTGQRTSLQYLVPAGRSPLEVLRNYQQEQKAAGFETAYECANEACGLNSVNMVTYELGSLLFPASYAAKAGDATPAACSTGAFVADVRYAVLDNKATGASMAVLAWRPGDVSAHCEEAEFKKHTGVFVSRIEPKAREQKMEALSAGEMDRSLGATGKVAIYGILFDTNKADIKPESKASMDQIGALLKQKAGLKLHVVGHTDSVGGFDANLALSRRRAEAVVASLVKDHGVARDRLTANGVASLAPVQTNADEAGRGKNRRVELVLQ
ncbi:MAG: OmpA family protein [Comamonadaceae bacterium]|nr:MAG: OmpA family protein [Comamonadaceae bacterium]